MKKKYNPFAQETQMLPIIIKKRRVKKEVFFYSYGGAHGKRHVQEEEGRIYCGAKSRFYDGGSVRCSFDGIACRVFDTTMGKDRIHVYKVDIEMVIDCKKCLKKLKKQAK